MDAKDERRLSGFGLVPLKGEGSPYHPDHLGMTVSDERYLDQLQVYSDCYGIEHTKNVFCCRPELLDKLEDNKDG